MDIQQNLELFRELMLCDGSIYSWSYDADGKLIFSNCPDQAVLAAAFDVFGCLKKMLAVGSERDTPIFLSSDTGLIWGTAFEKAENVLYALTPDLSGRGQSFTCVGRLQAFLTNYHCNDIVRL